MSASWSRKIKIIQKLTFFYSLLILSCPPVLFIIDFVNLPTYTMTPTICYVFRSTDSRYSNWLILMNSLTFCYFLFLIPYIGFQSCFVYYSIALKLQSCSLGYSIVTKGFFILVFAISSNEPYIFWVLGRMLLTFRFFSPSRLLVSIQAFPSGLEVDSIIMSAGKR